MCGMKLLIHSQTSTVQPLKFGNGWAISSHILLGMWLLIHAGNWVTYAKPNREQQHNNIGYRLTFNVSRTKSQILNVSRLVLQ